eukprot:TRINITY_DN11667_c1_g1_i1.p1 TRINITY_DN11667_c1_g1~~TRINITY_DN11667_c1_g1_i1.p1  ORF type:complete len:184 (+),score=26.87 TRINITY_DN11667_c1_g1_i1:73-624(+)
MNQMSQELLERQEPMTLGKSQCRVLAVEPQHSDDAGSLHHGSTGSTYADSLFFDDFDDAASELPEILSGACARNRTPSPVLTKHGLMLEQVRTPEVSLFGMLYESNVPHHLQCLGSFSCFESRGHGCRPCRFVAKGCRNGDSCLNCHMHRPANLSQAERRMGKKRSSKVPRGQVAISSAQALA